MHRPMAVLGSILLSAGIVLAHPEAACACSCAEVTDEAAYDDAAAVFTGTLVDGDLSTFGVPERDRILEFRVDEVYKGEVAELQGVATVGDGNSCGWELPAGEEYLVFATISDGKLYSGLCSGSRPIEEGAVFPDRAATAPIPGEADVDDAEAWPLIVGAVVLVAAVAAVVWWRLRRRLL